VFSIDLYIDSDQCLNENFYVIVSFSSTIEVEFFTNTYSQLLKKKQFYWKLLRKLSKYIENL